MRLATKVANDAIEKYKDQQFEAGDFAITIIDMRDPANLTTGRFNGEIGIYPASVVKLFLSRLCPPLTRRRHIERFA